MADQWLIPLYVDGDFTVAQWCSLPVLSSPIPHDKTEYVLKQEWCVFRKNFTPIDIQTAHPSSGMTPDYSTYLLCDESDREDIGGGIVKWTRTYAKKPATWSQVEGNYAYDFIGLAGNFGIGDLVTGRKRFNKAVPLKVTRDYYLIGSGGDYATSDLIPINAEQLYYFTNAYWPIDFLFDSPPFSAASNPSLTAYLALVSGGSYINVEASSVDQWLGNFFVRTTRQVKAL